ncbi:MAG: helix-turn-helix domain-containing protein [Chitinophagaceae bacterium]
MKTIQSQPILFPLSPDDFWSQLRIIVQEELAKNMPNQKQKIEFDVPGLVYKPLYKINEVCLMLGVTRPTIYDWVRIGKLKPYKIRSRVYFLWSDLALLFEPKKSL